MPTWDDYSISCDLDRLDLDVIHGFLSASYWAKNIPRALVAKSLRNSLCFGAFKGGRQVAFARVITDYATFGYVADVFVLPGHRGHGVSKMLMQAITDHPDLQGLRRLILATEDAHGLYAQFGFKPLPNPEKFMTIHVPNIYQQSRDE